jgi:hypothetical protein
VLGNTVVVQEEKPVQRGTLVGNLLARSPAIRFGRSHNMTTTTVDVLRLLQIYQHLYALSHETL